jgi:hypothetical protein
LILCQYLIYLFEGPLYLVTPDPESWRDDSFNNAQPPQAEAWGYWYDVPTGL